MNFINRLITQLARGIQHLDPSDYAVLAASVVLIGFCSRRGYGSRTKW